MKLGSWWGRGRGQARGWAGRGLERLRPEAAFSTRKGRGAGRVSSFLPEVKFPKLVADRTQATHPYLGEGAERAVFHFTLSIPVSNPS